jgi:hypothetical protein
VSSIEYKMSVLGPDGACRQDTAEPTGAKPPLVKAVGPSQVSIESL